MKKFSITLGILLVQTTAMLACDLCEKNQPELLQGVTHGTGPQGQMDFVITWSAVVIVAVVLFYSIKFLAWPRENRPGHIKNLVVNENPPPYE